MSVIPGRPVMAISIGMVTKRSTSSGDLPEASVAICTCTLATSGKASTERCCAAFIPKPTSTSATTTRTRRCRSEPAMMDCSMLFPSLDRVLLPLIIQVKRTVKHNAFALANAALQDPPVVRLRAQNHFAEHELVWCDLDEDVVPVFLANDGGLRHGKF